MAVLHVDEREPGVARQLRGSNELSDELLEIVVGQHADTIRKAPIEHRMRAVALSGAGRS